MTRRPGTPRLLRQINDRAALELLLSTGPMTRAQIGEMTGLSKVTASQLLVRLEERGLVQVVGSRAGGRGPSAALYAVVPSSAYVAGLDVGKEEVTAALSDITGQVVAEVTVNPNGSADPVAVVHEAVVKAARSAHVALRRLRAFVIGTPGIVDPRGDEMRFSFDLPAWHEGVIEALRGDLRRPVTVENDVNLAAMAERAGGVAGDVDDFVLVWVGRGPGMAVIVDGRLHRGFAGGAGEIGYLPVPGAPLPTDVRRGDKEQLGASFQSMVGEQAVRELAREHSLPHESGGAAVAAAADGAGGGTAFLDELAGRIAVGVASVCVVLDPELVVLGGDAVAADGIGLCNRIRDRVSRICWARPRIEPSTVQGNPVITGALQVAVDQAREQIFGGD